MEKIEFRKVRDYGELMNVTFEFIRQNIKLFGKSLLFIAGPVILISGILGGIYQSDMYSLSIFGSLYKLGSSFFLYSLSTMFVYLVIALISYNFILLYINKSQGFSEKSDYKESDQGEFGIDDVWKGVKENFWMAFFTMIGAFLLVAIGFVILIIPGIYLSIALFNILIIRMNERIGFIAALKRSFKLISGNWWFTFAYILLLSVIQFFFSFLFQIPSYIISFIIAFNSLQDGGDPVSSFLLIVVSIMSSFSFFFLVIIFVGFAVHYFNLVEQKEAAGLLAKIESIKV